MWQRITRSFAGNHPALLAAPAGGLLWLAYMIGELLWRNWEQGVMTIGTGKFEPVFQVLRQTEPDRFFWYTVLYVVCCAVIAGFGIFLGVVGFSLSRGKQGDRQ